MFPLNFEGDCPHYCRAYCKGFIPVAFFPLKTLFIMGKNHAASETIQNCVVIPKKPKNFTTAYVTNCMKMCNKQDMSQTKKPTSTKMLNGVYSVIKEMDIS